MVETASRLDDVHRKWNDEEKRSFFVEDFVDHATLDGGAAHVVNQDLPCLLCLNRSSPTKRLVLTCRNNLRLAGARTLRVPRCSRTRSL
jgi:hypothetical protein